MPPVQGPMAGVVVALPCAAMRRVLHPGASAAQCAFPSPLLPQNRLDPAVKPCRQRFGLLMFRISVRKPEREPAPSDQAFMPLLRTLELLVRRPIRRRQT